jgi:hypothetical protein
MPLFFQAKRPILYRFVEEWDADFMDRSDFSI